MIDTKAILEGVKLIEDNGFNEEDHTWLLTTIRELMEELGDVRASASGSNAHVDLLKAENADLRAQVEQQQSVILGPEKANEVCEQSDMAACPECFRAMRWAEQGKFWYCPDKQCSGIREKAKETSDE